jgi:GTPase SAR1 family protein
MCRSKTAQLWLIVCLSFVAASPICMFGAGLIHAQTPTATASAPADQAAPPASQSNKPPTIVVDGGDSSSNLWDVAWTFLASHFWTGIATLLAAIFAALSTALKTRLNALLLPPPVAIDETRNSVLVVGIGGTGKTSFIKALTGDQNANPRIATNEFRIYKYVQEIQNDAGGINRSNMYFTDYIGQNLSILIAGFIKEQKREYSPLRYGYLNSLILVVDLFSPPKVSEDPVNAADTFSQKRVNENIEEWRTQSLQAIFGLFTTDQLRYICLFINKFDLVSRHDEAMQRQILDAFAPLRIELGRLTRGAIFECRIGSAQNGQEIAHIKDMLTNVRGAQLPIRRLWFWRSWNSG